MPLSKMKKIWSYCTYNKPFFLLVFILFFVLEYFMDTYSNFNTKPPECKEKTVKNAHFESKTG